MGDAVLALNAGSSSIKFGLFRLDAEAQAAVARGLLQDQGSEPQLTVKDGQGRVIDERRWPSSTAHAELIGALLQWVDRHLGADRLAAVGHRIVHGGRDFQAPIRIDEPTLAALDALTPLAPLHQPRSLEPIRALQTLRPGLPQFGCFDTAFHKDLSRVVASYGIPRRFEADGVRKYGFHGLSYEFVASRLGEIDPALSPKRTIVAHLGQGASLCAIQNGRSLDTTMGFSALDGLVMGTRCGALDPGVVLYLQRTYGLDVDALEHLLYHDAGLLGVSGTTSDMRELVRDPDPEARHAVDLFAFRAAREVAALANTLGGLELLVFTGGIGEHSPEVRAAIGSRLGWLGIAIDPEANARAAARINGPDSRVDVRIVPTDEEAVIAKHVATLL